MAQSPRRGPSRAFIAVAGATAVLAGCLATAPLFLSTVATAAARVDLKARCPGTAVANFRTPYDSRFEISSNLGPLATRVPGAADPLTTDMSTTMALSSPHNDRVLGSGLLVHRSGESNHLHLIARSGSKGVSVPDWFAATYHVKPGDTLELNGVAVGVMSVPVIGVYRDVVTGPDASFWCPLESSFETTRFDDHKPAVLILDDAGAASYRSLFLQGETIWELPLAPHPTAHSIAAYVAHLGPVSATGAQVGSHYFGGVFQQQVVSSLGSVVHRAKQIRAFTAASIAPVRWSGALTGVVLVLAAALLFERRNRRQYRIRVLRGARPAALGVTAAARALPAVVLGAVTGVAVADVLIGAYGPSSDIDGAAIASAVRYAVLAVLVTLVVIMVTVALATRSFDRARRRQHRARLRHVPFELVAAVACFIAFRHLVDTGGVALAGADATRIDPLAIIFPLLLIWSVLIALGRPVFAVLSRVRTFGARANPAMMLGLRRAISDPSIGVVTSAAVAFCLATFVYSSALSTSIEASLQAKARTEVGADLRVGMTSEPRLDPAIAKHATHVTRGQGTFGSASVTVLGIDLDTFAKVAYWQRSFGPGSLSRLLAPLHDAGTGALPVLIVGEPAPAGAPLLAINAGRSTPARVVARARRWPSGQAGEILVVADNTALERRHLVGLDEVWLRGLPHLVPTSIESPGSTVLYSVPLSSVLDFNNTLPVRWSLGLLGAIGGVAGLAFAAAELAIIDSRARARQLSYLLWRRMGMTDREHRIACAVELGLPALLGACAALVTALVTVRITVGHLDALGSLPPPATYVFDARPLVLGLLVALAALALLAGWSERVTRSAEPLELIRVAE